MSDNIERNGTVGGHPSYDELEAEVRRLRKLLADNGIDHRKQREPNPRPFRGWLR